MLAAVYHVGAYEVELLHESLTEAQAALASVRKLSQEQQQETEWIHQVLRVKTRKATLAKTIIATRLLLEAKAKEQELNPLRA